MSNFETWWEREGQEFLYALNTTTDDDIKLVAEIAWKNGAYCAKQSEQEPVATDLMDMLRLIETIKYLRGIAERGLGREIRDDETIEQFVLGYVKQLEDSTVRTKDLTDDEERKIITETVEGVTTSELAMFKAVARSVIAAYKEKNK